MTVYVLDFSEPLKDAFSVNPGAYNGPGSTDPKSSLRMYGRGAPEWGEAVDENQLRLSENWASATPPVYAVEGQVWFAMELYWHNTSADTWFRWDYDYPATGHPTQWASFALDYTGDATPATPTIGQYWLTGATPADSSFKANTLYRWDTLYQQAPASWLERINSEATADPVDGVDFPKQNLRVYSGPSRDVWTGILLADGATPFTGNLDMGSFQIVNLADPTAATDAVTLQYADANYVNISGDTMTGILTLSADPTNALEAATKQYVDDTIASAGGTYYLKLDGTNVMAAALDMGTHQIHNVTDGVAATDAATVGQLSTASTLALSPDSGSVGTPTAPKYYFATYAPTTEGNDGDVWFQYTP